MCPLPHKVQLEAKNSLTINFPSGFPCSELRQHAHCTCLSYCPLFSIFPIFTARVDNLTHRGVTRHPIHPPWISPWDARLLPVWQVLPVHPALHVHVLGSVQEPWTQPGEQTAVRVNKTQITCQLSVTLISESECGNWTIVLVKFCTH